MEEGDNSGHLRPYILPPLGVPKLGEEAGKVITNTNAQKQLRQRIGTPAPQKKSPIPDDLNLDNLNGKRGNPAIRVESYKSDECQKNRNHGLTDMKLKPLSEGVIVGGNNKCTKLSKKPQLQPIVSSSLLGNQNGSLDLNGNDIRRHYSRFEVLPDMKSVPLHLGKVRLPNKYPPLKPIKKKKVFFEQKNV